MRLTAQRTKACLVARTGSLSWPGLVAGAAARDQRRSMLPSFLSSLEPCRARCSAAVLRRLGTADPPTSPNSVTSAPKAGQPDVATPQTLESTLPCTWSRADVNQASGLLSITTGAGCSCSVYCAPRDIGTSENLPVASLDATTLRTCPCVPAGRARGLTSRCRSFFGRLSLSVGGSPLTQPMCFSSLPRPLRLPDLVLLPSRALISDTQAILPQARIDRLCFCTNTGHTRGESTLLAVAQSPGLAHSCNSIPSTIRDSRFGLSTTFALQLSGSPLKNSAPHGSLHWLTPSPGKSFLPSIVPSFSANFSVLVLRLSATQLRGS